MFELNTSELKKVLVVDDSAFMRKLISSFIDTHPKLEVVGTARNGQDAIEKIDQLKPDVVTMDIEMPLMNGLEALKEIMSKNPLPVIMLSSTTKIGAENTMLAMEYGAFDFVAKPGGAISLNLHEVKEEIIEKVAAASGVQIYKLKRLEKINKTMFVESKIESITPAPKDVFPMSRMVAKTQLKKFSRQTFSKSNKTFVMIGTSTGGPRALQEVLTKIPQSIGAPILIVQHMPPGFTKSLADRLDGLSKITVKEAEDGELLVNGTAYVAPGGKHLKVKKVGAIHQVWLDDVEPLRSGHRPAVDVLFESAAELSNVNYLAVVMTGMGYDGMAGVVRLKERGNTIAIAESAETSVVYGMPKAIVDAGLADEIVNIQNMTSAIMEQLKI